VVVVEVLLDHALIVDLGNSIPLQEVHNVHLAHQHVPAINMNRFHAPQRPIGNVQTACLVESGNTEADVVERRRVLVRIVPLTNLTTVRQFQGVLHALHVVLDRTSQRLAMQVARIEVAPHVRPRVDLVFGRARLVPPPPTAYAQLVSNARLGRP
tara:strand:+ start:3783 stop:4247 length:465 start_codon:yes stop_codon:yes gene_type:complete